jgi:hypothetical protein
VKLNYYRSTCGRHKQSGVSLHRRCWVTESGIVIDQRKCVLLGSDVGWVKAEVKRRECVRKFIGNFVMYFVMTTFLLSVI